MPPWCIVHELGHIFTGGGGEFLAINMVRVNDPTIITAMAGFTAEFLVFFIIGYTMIIGKRYTRLGWFFYCGSFATWHQFPRSQDFTLMNKYINAHVFLIFWYFVMAGFTLLSIRGFIKHLVDDRKAEKFLKQFHVEGR
jgi:hypothetical protein